jgi:hypothetical protein
MKMLGAPDAACSATEVDVNQLALMGLLPSPAATGSSSWHAVWPLVLLVMVLFAVLPLARLFGKHG